MKTKLALIIMTILLPVLASNSAPVSDPLRALDHTNGLSSNYINSFTFDSRGCIWIGTDQGLSLYDSGSLAKIEIIPEELASAEILSVEADTKGESIWVAARNQGIYCLNAFTGAIKTKIDTSPKGKTPLRVRKLRRFSNDQIWFAYAGGIGYIEKGTLHTFTPADLPGLPAKITDLAEGPDSSVIIASSRGAGFINPIKKRIKLHSVRNGNLNGLPSENIGAVCCNPSDGTVWFASDHGISKYDKSTDSFLTLSENKGLPICYVESMALTSDGHLWANLAHLGVWHLDLMDKNCSFSKLMPRHKKDLTFENVTVKDLQEDKFGNLWFGTDGAGLWTLGNIQSPFRWLKAPDNMSNTITTAIGLGNGTITTGGFNGYVDVISNPDSDSPSFRSIYLEDNNLTSITSPQGTDEIWVASIRKGIHVFRDGRMVHKIDLPIYPLAMTSTGDTVYVLSPNSLVAISAADRKILFTQRLADNLVYPTSMSTDAAGRIWIGTNDHGIYLYDPSHRTMVKTPDSLGLDNCRINQLTPLRDKLMAVASSKGLLLISYNHGRLALRDIKSDKNPLLRNPINSIAADGHNQLWIASPISLTCLNPKTMEMTTYNAGELNLDGNFTKGCSAASCTNLAFGSTNGVMTFQSWPGAYRHGRSSAPFHLTALKAFSSDSQPSFLAFVDDNEIRLNHSQNTFSIYFATDNYHDQRGTSFVYRLKGLSDKWIEVGNEGSVTFHNLPPGDYVFELRTISPQNVMGDEIKTANIDVKPPVYASIWAEGLYVLVAIALIWWIIVLYKKSLVNRNEKKLHEADLQRIKEFNEDRLRFYTNITHELKTPLTLILAPAEDLMNNPSLTKDSHDKANLIAQNANRLLELINQLLTFRQCETNHISFSPSYGNISRVSASITDMFRQSNTNGALQIHASIQPDVMCMYDTQVISVILTNLMSNAVKYTSSGNVTLKMNMVGKNIVFIVSDTGIGITKKDAEHIFDRYYQGSNRPQVEGFGIGLAVVHKLVKLHNGKIEVAPGEHGIGSAFTVTIPFVKSFSAETTGTQPSITHEEIVHDDQGHKIILIADDNTEIADYIAHLLSDTYDVYTAANGKQALELAHQHIPDIIISDIIMPEMDGIELCGKVKNDEVLCHIPVILLTAKSMREDIAEGYKTGADSYITKPFTAQIIRSRVDNLIASRERLAKRLQKTIVPTRAAEHVDPSQVAEVQAPPQLNPLDLQFIDKLNSIISENISSPDFNTNMLAASMNMSPSTLYRKIRSVVGLSVIEYVKKFRMKLAAELLQSGEYNVSETAWKTGISNVKYFRECFRETYGMTPTEYCAKIKGTHPEDTD